MTVYLNMSIKTKEKLTLEKGQQLLNYLFNNGCTIQKDRGYWDTKKEDWIPSSLNQAIKKYLNKEAYTFKLIFESIEFIFSVNYNKNEIFFSIDHFFINKYKNKAMESVESLKKLIGDKIKIKSINEEYG